MKPAARAWLTVGLLWVVGGLNYLDRLMITTMHSAIVGAIPMTEAQFGLLTAGFLWVYALLSPLAGFLSDRYSRSGVIVASMAVWSTLTLLTRFAHSFEQLLCLRALMGVSEACYLPAALALIAEYHRGPTRSLAMGVHLTGIGVGGGLGGMGGWLAERHVWTYPFSIFGAAGLLYCFVLIALLRDAPREAAGVDSAPARLGPALASLFSRGAFLLALLFWGCLGFASWLGTGWWPTYFHEHFHLPPGQAGFFSLGAARAANFLGYLAGGAISDWASRRRERGRILVPAVALLLAAPLGSIVLFTHSIGLAMVGFLASAFLGAFVDPNLMPILCLVADPRYRATGYGVLNLIACLIGGASIYAGGVLRDAHLPLENILLAGVATTIAAALILLLIRPAPAAGQLRSISIGRT